MKRTFRSKKDAQGRRYVYPISGKRTIGGKRTYRDRAPPVRNVVIEADGEAEEFRDQEGSTLRAFSEPGDNDTMVVGDYWKGRKDEYVADEFAMTSQHENIHKGIEEVAGEDASIQADGTIRSTVQNEQIYLPDFETMDAIDQMKRAGASDEEILATYDQVYAEGKLTMGELQGITDYVTGKIQPVRETAHPAVTDERPKIEYNPERFPGMVYRPDEDGPTAMIFENGRIVVSGASSESEARSTIHKVAEDLNEKGIRTEEPHVKSE